MKGIKSLCFILVIFYSVRSYSQCNGIDFSANKTAICAPDVVTFIASNIPAGSSVRWDFGGGEEPGNDTLQHIFTAGGSYTIVLKVTFPDGVTVCTVSKPNYIFVADPPKPNIAISQQVLCNGPGAVTFTDQSTGATSRSWIIDGIPLSDSSVSITHTFTSNGFKQVVLALSSQYCPTTYYKIDSAVRIYPPLDFDFSADKTSGCAPMDVVFTPTINSTGHTISSYQWNFPGGNPASSNLIQPTVNYSAVGNFDASLTLTNTDGCTKQVSKTAYINIGTQGGFTVNVSSSQVCRRDVVTLSISDPSLPGSFGWDLGNGTPQSGSTPTSQRVIFNDTGYQYFKVTRSYNGCTVVQEYPSSVYLRPPMARFSILNPIECDSSVIVQLQNTSKVSPLYTYTYTWRLYAPDNSLMATYNDSVPSFATNRNGTFDLELEVTGSNGCTDILKVNDEIIRSRGKAEFTTVPDISCPGKAVTFRSTSPPFSSAEPNVHEWTIYDTDGTTILQTKNSGIIFSTNYTFNNTGNYKVSLRVYNSKCSDIVTHDPAVRVISPTTSFNISDLQPCVKTSVSLTASTVPNISPASYTYTWTFQNTANPAETYTASGQPSSISIPKSGIYNFKLVTSWNGCTDSIIRNNHVFVSGPVLTLNSSNNSDCVPLVTTATAFLNQNHNYKAPGNGTVTYSWSANPSAGVVFDSPNASVTQVTINQKGMYELQIVGTNASGCSDTFKTTIPINSGVEGDYLIDTNVACKGDTIFTTNKSTLDPQAYEWFSVPAGAQFFPSNTFPSPEIIFPDSGNFDIYQVVSKKNTCFDTTVKTIRSVGVVAGFYTLDTANYCAPIKIDFVSTTVNADSLTWYFGDGDTLTIPNQQNVSHVYFKNSGPAGFDVTLLAANNLGCKDSITLPGYLKIYGPVPFFSLDTSQGCAPLDVRFVDNSTSYRNYYFDFGDGSGFDTTGNPGTHRYVIPNVVDEKISYKPKLLLVDFLGCFSEYEYPGEITVYNQPIVGFSVDTTEGCKPLKVTFTDTSRFVKFYEWDFDADGDADDTAKNTVHIYSTEGVYSVRLKGTSQYGCIQEDTLVNGINVKDVPFADFFYSKIDTDTASTTYNFTNASSNFDSSFWFVDTMFIESNVNFEHRFFDTGQKIVQLVVKSPDGCLDTTRKSIFVTPDFMLFIPNAFTPNGNENNETFGPFSSLFHRQFMFRIFNRYGEQVFESTNIKDQWDGTYKGEKCQQDQYIYTVEYLDMGGTWHTFHGTVMLLR